MPRLLHAGPALRHGQHARGARAHSKWESCKAGLQVQGASFHEHRRRLGEPGKPVHKHNHLRGHERGQVACIEARRWPTHVRDRAQHVRSQRLHRFGQPVVRAAQCFGQLHNVHCGGCCEGVASEAFGDRVQRGWRGVADK